MGEETPQVNPTELPSSGISFVEVDIHDEAAMQDWIDLYQQVFPDDYVYSLEELQGYDEETTDSEYKDNHYIMMDGDKKIGICWTFESIEQSSCYISYVGVTPENQGQGKATEALINLEKNLDQKGIQYMLIETEDPMKADPFAQAETDAARMLFYMQRLGYQFVDPRIFPYLHPSDEDDTIDGEGYILGFKDIKNPVDPNNAPATIPKDKYREMYLKIMASYYYTADEEELRQATPVIDKWVQWIDGSPIEEVKTIPL